MTTRRIKLQAPAELALVAAGYGARKHIRVETFALCISPTHPRQVLSMRGFRRNTCDNNVQARANVALISLSVDAIGAQKISEAKLPSRRLLRSLKGYLNFCDLKEISI